MNNKATGFAGFAGHPAPQDQEDFIDAVLFSCTMNSVRSPMAEGLAKYIYGTSVYFDSAGVRSGEPDYLMIEVMDELGIDMRNHHAKSLEELQDTSFDLIITLSPEAQHHALEFTRTMACEVELWRTLDPTIIEGSRDVKLNAYREVRNQIKMRLQKRMGGILTPINPI